MMRLPSVALILLLATNLMPAQVPNSVESGLQQTLVGKYLTLRTPYAGDELAFSVDGSPMGKSQHGLRSIDGFIRVKSVQLQNATVVIKAERILMIYNVKTGSLVSGGLNPPLDIRIDMPSATAEHISEMLAKVFFSAAELDARACSVDEKLAFQDMVSKASLKAGKNIKKGEGLQREVLSFCFPTGDKVFTVGKGIPPPKAVRTPDPEYDVSARREGVQGTSTFVLAIGPDGLPTDALLVEGVDPRLNYKAIGALRGWTFKPAVRDGTPVPVMVNVDINFWLR